MNTITYIINGKPIEIPSHYASLIRSKYKKEIAAEYGLNDQAFRRRMCKHKLNNIPRGYVDEPHVLLIYLTMGWPCKV
jgi:hypothetical protein